VDLLPLFNNLFESALPNPDGISIFRTIAGVVSVFLLPGFVFKLVFFQKGKLSILETIVLSFGLSIAMITLSVLSLNMLFGIVINGVNSVLIIISLIIIPTLIYCFRKFIPAIMKKS